MNVELVYESHSLTEDNERGHATGWLDGRLSETGRLLAAELGERRRNDGIDAVFVSDLGRAVETAEIALGGTEIPIFRESRLRECNYGSLNGAALTRLDAEGPQGLDNRYPNGESWRQAVARVNGFLAELVRARSGERVLVIGHMSAWYALECIAREAPLDEVFAIPMKWREGWFYALDERSVAEATPSRSS